jgi:hypothetical protein
VVGCKDERTGGRDVVEAADFDATVKDPHEDPGERKKQAIGHRDHGRLLE